VKSVRAQTQTSLQKNGHLVCWEHSSLTQPRVSAQKQVPVVLDITSSELRNFLSSLMTDMPPGTSLFLCVGVFVFLYPYCSSKEEVTFSVYG
jgi:hypothetical protein